MSTKSKLELAVDSGKWEDGLKKAQSSMRAFEQSIGGLEKATSAEKELMTKFIHLLGNTKSTASTASQQMKEYKGTIERLQVISTKLNGEQKKLAEDAMAKLTKRMQEAKGQVDQLNQSMNETSDKGNITGNVLDQLAGKFGLSTKQLTEFGAALALGKAALDTMKGAIEINEATHDVYARTVEACDAVTNQFLTDLANADFSNFISGLQGVIDKAIDAYNALDEFESYAARFNPAQQAQEAKIQTLMQQARAAKAQGDNAKAERLNNEAKDLINKLEQTTREYGKKQTTAGYATIRGKMGEVDITDQQIAWYADPKNWDKAQQKAKEFQRIQNEIQRDQQTLNSNLGWSETAKKMYADADARLKANQQALRNDPSLKRAYTFQNLRDSGEKGAAFRQALSNIYGNTMAESRVESLRARADRMDGVIANGIKTPTQNKTYGISMDISEAVSSGLIEGIKMVEPGEAMKDFVEGMKTKIQEGLGQIEPLKITDGSTYDYIGELKDNVNGIASAFNAASGALGQFAGESEEAAIAAKGFTIAGAIAQLVAQFASIPKGAEIWSWIAGTVAGTGTLVATIASLKSATAEYHAQGGVVGSGPFIPRGTDTVPAMLTPGEVVLNASQQRTLASNLQSNGQTGGVYESITRAEDVVTIINTWGKRTGKGEIMFG